MYDRHQAGSRCNRHRHNRTGCLTLLWVLVTHLSCSALAQEETPVLAELKADLTKQVDLLGDASYRKRQLARWRLERHPLATIEVIRTKINDVSHNAAAELIDLLTVFATEKDVLLSLAALDLLKQRADEISAIGRLATNSLNAIEDLQEEQAIEILVQNEAYIGPRNFKINAQVDSGEELSLHIDDRFTGDGQTIQWIRFLKSVETVYLEGEVIDRRHLEVVSKLTQVQNIKLQHVNIQPEDLEQLRDFTDLRHLGLNYVNVDDRVIDVLAKLPMSQSLRLYGTQVTPEGIARLKKQLDGIDIYGGRGGFLGVATGPRSTRVTIVTNNSAAEQAGIRTNDRLTEINGIAITNFEELRGELGKFLPGDEIKVKLVRGSETLELDVMLREDDAD